ncbi:MAG TPA: hypothetical protein VMF61_06485 [Candidatus Acidoferrales bacterium]|nr:hypothetical protein [Candidatus Acidoferrales bacterium]
MFSVVDVPPVPMASILNRAAIAAPANSRRVPPYARLAYIAAAAAALAFAIVPKASIAVIERIVVDSYSAAYRVMGWTPPPSPPKPLADKTSAEAHASEATSLAAARSKVAFALVPPAGLPSDAVLVAIRVMPVLSYDTATRVWSKDSPALQFEYRRPGGRAFEIMAEKDDPRTGPPSKFVYEAQDMPGGKVALAKRAHFAWTNGDQLTSMTADGVTPAEITAIRSAMNGRPVVHHPTETVVKQIYLR